MTYRPQTADPHADTRPLIKGPAAGLVIYILGIGCTIGVAGAGVAHAKILELDQRMIRLEERDAAKAETLKEIKQGIGDIVRKLDDISGKIRQTGP